MNDSAIDLRCGRWQDALADVEHVDALICDPPYSARTDSGYRTAADFTPIANVERVARTRKDIDTKQRNQRQNNSLHGSMPRGRFELAYAPIVESDARAFVAAWAPRVRDWLVIFGDHVSHRWFEFAMQEAGLVTFAPVPWVRTNSAPRFNADGPANACEWIAIGRPVGLPRDRRSRVGFYSGSIGQESAAKKVITGGKPLWLMQALVRDYSRPGDLICDPCAGGATTLLAAAIEGRRAVGSEMDPATYAKAQKRIAKGYTPGLAFATEREPMTGTTEGLFKP